MPVLLLLIGCGGDAVSATIRNDAGNAASLSALLAPATTPDTSSPESGAKTLSADVVAFRDRRDRCDHFRGEEPGDEARAAELEKLLNETCRGNATATAALRDYEDGVE